MKITEKLRKPLAALSCAVFILAGYILTGCSLSSPMSVKAPDADKLYTVQCEITVKNGGDEFTYSGSMSRLGGGIWEMTLASPDTVKGLKLGMDSSGITASLGDLNFRLESDKIPDRAAFVTVFGILDNAAAAEDLRFAETETALCYYGSCSGTRYTLKYDKATNTLCSLETDGITAEFTGFTVTGSASSETSETAAQTAVSEAA